MTFEDAKKLFFKYDGSLFVIAREERENYEKYKLLNISGETLEIWKRELFFSLWEQLKETGASELFNKMYELSENQHNRENLLILQEALYKVNYINYKINACISETVIGRKDVSVRSGMIFWAYDLGEQKIAEELLQFIWGLATVQTSDESIMRRFERIIKKCYVISYEINYLNFPT